MMIPVVVVSNITGNVLKSEINARDLIDIYGEDQLIEELTKCECDMIPRGETNLVECECYEEWLDCKVYIGNEILRNEF